MSGLRSRKRLLARPSGVLRLGDHPIARGLGCWYRLNYNFLQEIVQNHPITPDNSSGDLSLGTGLPRLGNGVQFNTAGASNDRLDLGSMTPAHPFHLGGATAFSILFWFIADGLANNDRVVDRSNSGTAAEGWAIWSVGTNVFTLRSSVGIASDSGTHTFNADGKPHLGVVTWDNSNFVWYFDGAVSSSGVDAGSIATTTTNGAIGNWNHTTNRMFGGRLFDVAVWPTRAITATEVLSLYLDPNLLFWRPRTVVGFEGAVTPPSGTGTFTLQTAAFAAVAEQPFDATSILTPQSAGLDAVAEQPFTSSATLTPAATSLDAVGEAPHTAGGTVVVADAVLTAAGVADNVADMSSAIGTAVMNALGTSAEVPTSTGALTPETPTVSAEGEGETGLWEDLDIEDDTTWTPVPRHEP